jgi:hypothetical protein
MPKTSRDGPPYEQLDRRATVKIMLVLHDTKTSEDHVEYEAEFPEEHGVSVAETLGKFLKLLADTGIF